MGSGFPQPHIANLLLAVSSAERREAFKKKRKRKQALYFFETEHTP